MTIDEFKKNIAPFMRPGYVAMDKNGRWYYYRSHPDCSLYDRTWNANAFCECLFLPFDIEPVEDWTKSLIEVGK